MARYSRFTFLCDTDERQAIITLAARLQRSQSSAVRFVVIEAARQLSQASTTCVASKPVKAKNVKQGLKFKGAHLFISGDKESA